MLLTEIWNSMMLKRKKVKYGKNLHISGRVYFHGLKDRIVLGNGVTIISTADVNPTSGFGHSHFRVEGKGKIIIGNNVGLSHVNITSYDSIEIEDNVLIGSGVKVWDTDFHPIKYDERVIREEANSKPIIIREGAFVGACSIILKGVIIGKHAVVGAGSVVTKDVPDNEIWAGNPAKFVKSVE